MNAERLLALFEQISEAPYAISRLRRFILDLAVRGKLVEQDPEDEPAEELLALIAREKEISSNKGLSKDKYTAPKGLRIGETLFSVPDSWKWVELGEILLKLTDGTHHSPPNSNEGDYKYITAKNIKPDGISLEGVTYVSESVHREIYSRCNPAKGDILYIKDGATTGVVTINNLDEPFSMLSSVALMKPASCVFNKLIVTFLRSPFFYEQMRGLMKGAAITRVTLKRMSPALIPLPPLAEQHRIVAKVDELMALCDQLAAARQQREQCRERLVASNLQRLHQPSDEPEAFRSDARFALQVLPSFTSTPAQIKQLRQTILNLAVRGKLVEQDPEDESAAIELQIVEELKARQKCKKPKKVSTIEASEQWCTIPERWAWARWGQVSDWITYGFTRPMEHVANGIPIITGKNVNHGQILFDDARLTPLSAFENLSEKDKPQPGDILITKDGSIGRTAIVDQDNPRFCINQSVAVMWLRSCHFDRRFLQIVLDSPQTQEVLLAKTAGVAIKHISITDLGKMVFPLPPLAEQHRIVAKVDELMALCDQLEQQLSQAEQSRRELLEAVLREALVEAERMLTTAPTSLEA